MSRAQKINVSALLQTTLGRERPVTAIEERVRSRVALLNTVSELVLLMTAAPWSGFAASMDSTPEPLEEEKTDANHSR